jgi:hypothetical protein
LRKEAGAAAGGEREWEREEEGERWREGAGVRWPEGFGVRRMRRGLAMMRSVWSKRINPVVPVVALSGRASSSSIE